MHRGSSFGGTSRDVLGKLFYGTIAAWMILAVGDSVGGAEGTFVAAGSAPVVVPYHIPTILKPLFATDRLSASVRFRSSWVLSSNHLACFFRLTNC
eukprot:scaffold34685_cov183-Amphora_coffeaeformis.AAC.41